MRRTHFWLICRTLWVNKLIFTRFEKFNFEDEIRSSPGLINIKVHFRDYYQNLQSPEFITHNSPGFISHSLWEDQKGESRRRMRRLTDGGMTEWSAGIWSRWRLRSFTSSSLISGHNGKEPVIKPARGRQQPWRQLWQYRWTWTICPLTYIELVE